MKNNYVAFYNTSYFIRCICFTGKNAAINCLIKTYFVNIKLQIGAKITFERIDVEYYNSKFSFINSTNRHFNRTTKMTSITFMLFQPVSEDSTASIFMQIKKSFANKLYFYFQAKLAAYIFVGNKYILSPIQFEKRIKDMFNYDYFDFVSLTRKYAKPQIVWPIKPNVSVSFNANKISRISKSLLSVSNN